MMITTQRWDMLTESLWYIDGVMPAEDSQLSGTSRVLWPTCASCGMSHSTLFHKFSIGLKWKVRRLSTPSIFLTQQGLDKTRCVLWIVVLEIPAFLNTRGNEFMIHYTVHDALNFWFGYFSRKGCSCRHFSALELFYCRTTFIGCSWMPPFHVQ